MLSEVDRRGSEDGTHVVYWSPWLLIVPACIRLPGDSITPLSARAVGRDRDRSAEQISGW